MPPQQQAALGGVRGRDILVQCPQRLLYLVAHLVRVTVLNQRQRPGPAAGPPPRPYDPLSISKEEEQEPGREEVRVDDLPGVRQRRLPAPVPQAGSPTAGGGGW